MTDGAASEPDSRRTGHLRAAGAVLLVALAALHWAQTPWTARLQAAWFDALQAFSPRQIQSMPATIVAVDQKSLAALGQWPWPRDLLAELVEAIARGQPAAIALDILMPEADALSPDAVLRRSRKRDPTLAAALGAIPSNDARLAAALAAAPSVLAVAGTHEPTGLALRAVPFSVKDSEASAATPAVPELPSYRGALTSIDTLDRAAAGHGFISVDPERGVIRRIPLVASIDGTLVPALAVEMLRVAVQAPSLRLLVTGPRIDGVAIGDFIAPSEDDGAARIYFSPPAPGRFVSAVDVLAGTVDPNRLQRKLVVIGVTGLGLIEYQNTPTGDRMPGSEIHAQLLENLFDQTLLRRPGWASTAESALLLVIGALLIAVTPRWKPLHAALLLFAGLAILIGAAWIAFRSQRLLFDGAVPSLDLVMLYGLLLAGSLAEATRRQRSLERALQVQRERSARMAGELEAASRIQTASLPSADALGADLRIDLDATMIPARETGGDLYDFFRLDDHRLFFLIGDVAGKGLSASIFMAVSKALYKSATLRMPTTDMGELMAMANVEISRDNPEMLFVTAFAGMLDLDTGDLDYCNAGHENPYRIRAGDDALLRIADGDGPPLCAVGEFEYHGGHLRLAPGDVVCLVTDGVTEAENPAGEFYGSGRVAQVLGTLGADAANPRAVISALRADVLAFSSGADAADDLTILAFCWRGGAD